MSIDVIKVKEIALRLSASVSNYKHRFFLDTLNLKKEPRIKVLRGFRGVGKTTALLQLMSSIKHSIYFSMDHPYIRNYSFYETSKALINQGYKIILVDEVHTYDKWYEDVKALYDEYNDVYLVVSGSAPLAFNPDRRYQVIDVEPLSLSELAHLVGSSIPKSNAWKDIDESLLYLSKYPNIYSLYANYMQGGAFPLYLTYKENTLDAIYNSIEKSLKEDAVFFGNLDGKTILGMERLLYFLAISQLGEFSINSISRKIGISKYKTYEIVRLMESMKILRLVKPYGKSFVRGEPKLMFYHPVMRSAVCRSVGETPSRGALREELAVFCLTMRGWRVYTAKGMKRSPDYIITRGRNTAVVEVGGSSKSKYQLKGFKNIKKILLDERQLMVLAAF